MFKRERFILLLVITIVFGLAVYIWSQAPKIEIEYPEKPTILTPDDYLVQTDQGPLVIGENSFDQVVQIYPDGGNLGLSTIYKPEHLKMNLTFSEDDNILIFAHIEEAQIYTGRGTQVGDSYSQVIQTYGKNYTLIRNANNANDFDLVYGPEDKHNLIFQIRDDAVAKIIVHNEP